ncbi:FtsK/SpoIIIE domain-containing protein [Kocuria sp.]|uniref:FtsK/SpoIIIE domain-containing protein n=1 Tax=Kocuria sp. TaxID=1871328 RepID=UPI0026DB6F7B|nr:FtsK/SpoIIIE domain-containing protein [Kocuria sp.]MDO4918638.1 FtsK/SpoIIIE domain-containing protein [Kocuria sp.]
MDPPETASTAAWRDPSAPPAGFTAREADPAHPLPVGAVSRGRAVVAMATGLLPLGAGIGIALFTHWWFFLVFSALGAVTTVAGWFADRGTRAENRTRLAAALERDLRRCEHAAPAVSALVARCLPPGPRPEPVGTAGGTGSGDPTRFPAATGAPGTASPAGNRAGWATAPGVPPRRWVRLGHGPRPAQLARERGTPLSAVTHGHAPVLVDLAELGTIALAADPELTVGVLNALVLQLFTGPAALHRLRVSPDVPWQAPVADLAAPDPTALSADEVPTHLTTLEVLTPDTAEGHPLGPGTVRVLVTLGEEPDGADATLTTTGDGLRLSTHACAAVPGLSGAERRSTLDFVPDTVSRRTAMAALQGWRHSPAGRTASARGGLPRLTGSHELLTPAPEISPTRVRPQRTVEPGGAEPAGVPGPRRATAGLRTAIGVSRAGVQHVELDDENPHLLVAGTTGCGKSEVLRSLVAGLAREYPPSRLEFLFVDFKGGAALAPLTALPHPSTLLTDLGPDEVRRALAFLRSELHRRERVLLAHGHDSMTQLLRDAGASSALRELVVVVDEAKMLTDSFPEAAHHLAVVATVGRSLGVHLVLATQRPQGALPADVRANISQALCLRVRTDQESLDVIGSVAAARVSPRVPGRGFLDRGDGAPVELQCVVLTRLAPPEPAPLRLCFLTRDFLAQDSGDPDDAARPGCHAPRGGQDSDNPCEGVVQSVADVRQLWSAAIPGRATDERPGTGGLLKTGLAPGSKSGAVPPGLPRRVPAVAAPDSAVDLGAGESPTEHWCGRFTWHPWRDGPLALVGRPEAVLDPLRSLLLRCAASRVPTPSAASGTGAALYIVTAGGGAFPDLLGADGEPLHPAVRGTARADEPADLAHLLGRLREHLERHGAAAGPCAERAVLAVTDWDRCCQLLRAGPWSHLEDEMLALLVSGPARGLSALLAGDRTLVAGRGSQVGPNRLYFPGGQAPDALLHWPRLPPFTPHEHRAAVSGPVSRPAADGEKTPSEAGPPPRGDEMAVVQVAEGPGTRAAPASAGNTGTTASPGGTNWPRCFPLPRTWAAPRCHPAGLLLGVTRDGAPAVHPWGPGATLLVAGPARSGRSTFLDAARAGLAPDAPRRAGDDGVRHRVVRAAPRDAEEVHALLRSLEHPHRAVTLLLDDAERMTPEALRALAGAWHPRPWAATEHPVAHHGSSPGNPSPVPPPQPSWLLPGVRIVLGVQLTDSLLATFPPLPAWRQHADTLLLTPRRAFDGDMFGASLAGLALGGPPGRGYWLHRGTAEPVQTPTRRAAPPGDGPTDE